MGGILFYFGFVLGKNIRKEKSGRALKDRRIASQRGRECSKNDGMEHLSPGYLRGEVIGPMN